MLTFDDRLSFINKVDTKLFKDQIQSEQSIKVQSKDTGLPILLHEREIMEQVENFVITVVCGETGSGKSTQLP